MRPKIRATVTTGFVSASLAVAATVGDTLAGAIKPRDVMVTHPSPHLWMQRNCRIVLI
jgi:hypothetical protein